ncbi:MAG TPA: 4-hydroxyphenylacetate 3-hydroxylase N-terminal domain-containing protein, partial [Candidatus Deferrimicrobiaceae bacterium]|nr:4-hydroxyphenylacetate 3-hydroxylase N-terminal domain-containing protein [Candidatus Deferrimicrobiaceae bacterium]
MALRTREQYLASLKEMRPNIHKFGELIRDVTTHPATRRVVESHARAFDAASDPRLTDVYTTVSSFTGERIFRFNSLMASLEDTIGNMKLKRASYRRTGTCSGGTCVGWNAA